LGSDTADLQRVYAKPVEPTLLRRRLGELRAAGVRVAVRLSPQHTAEPRVRRVGTSAISSR
ncbi:MAG TPA: hypothetical protein VGH01_02420, partial [Jatrophihabitantaceae bacterium]